MQSNSFRQTSHGLTDLHQRFCSSKSLIPPGKQLTKLIPCKFKLKCKLRGVLSSRKNI